MPIEISPLRLLAFTALILAGLAVAGLVWVALVRWYYRLREPRPTRTLIQCADGWELALYHRAPTVRRYREPVILVHGLAANHYTFDFDSALLPGPRPGRRGLRVLQRGAPRHRTLGPASAGEASQRVDRR